MNLLIIMYPNNHNVSQIDVVFFCFERCISIRCTYLNQNFRLIECFEFNFKFQLITNNNNQFMRKDEQ